MPSYPTNIKPLPRVAILLSTRDGAKYLVKQLESLIYQLQVQVHVFWSDDGSKDHTVSIVNSFKTKLCLNPLELPLDHHPGDHFLRLLYQVPKDYDYYAFCDQDDIWLPNKLNRAIQKLIEYQCDLYGSRTQLIDEEDSYLQKSMNFSKPPSFQNALVQSIAGGNTMVWTNKLHQKISDNQVTHVPSHDWWIYLFSSFMGFSMYYDRKAFILYRQHSKNTVGANLGAINQLKRIFLGLRGRYKDWNSLHKKFIDQHLYLGTKENVIDYYFFQSSRLDWNPINRIKNLDRSKVYRQTLQGKISLFFATMLYLT